MSQLPLSLVVNVSVSQAPAGLGEFNVNNLIVFTDDVPAEAPANGYEIFLTPEGIADQYGSSSQTSQMANEIFAQSPNILAGGGQLIVAPLLLDLGAVTAVQTVTPSIAPTSGVYKLNYNGDITGNIAYDASAGTIQTAVQTLTGLTSATVAGTLATHLTITLTGTTGPVSLLTASDSTLTGAGSVAVELAIVTTVPGRAAGSTEVLVDAIQRLAPLVSFCGIIKTDAFVTNELTDAAVYAQTQHMIIFAQSASVGDVAETTGVFWQIQDAALSQTRCLLYLEDDYAAASLMAAAYAGRALSTNFDGSNTTQNMHLKTLIGIVSDTGMTTTIYTLCQAAGVDVYPSVQGVAKVLASGQNRFFDQVYNQMWLVTQLEVAIFNALATTSTKIPQTEQGMSVLKGAAQNVCEQAKANLYCAPGSWSGGTFGNQQDFLRNIRDIGYYVYSSPIATQSQVDREAREAPLMQIAVKEAGAIDSASVLVNINA